LGYELTFATSAVEALNAASGRAFELAVCDVDIPGIDGLELRRRLESGSGREVPLVFTTTRPDRPRDRFVMRDAPLLVKPVTRAQLGAAVDFVLRRETHRLRARNGALQGRLADTTLADLCLFVRDYTLSGAATLRVDSAEGRVWFALGELTHAECGALSSEAAFREMLGWRKGEFELRLGDSRVPRTIRATLADLLQNAASAGLGAQASEPADSDWQALRQRLPADAESVELERGDALMCCEGSADRERLLSRVTTKTATLAAVLDSGAFASATSLSRLVAQVESGAVVLRPSPSARTPEEQTLAEWQAEVVPTANPAAAATLPAAPPEPRNEGAPSKLAAPTVRGLELKWEPPLAELVDEELEEDEAADSTPPKGTAVPAGALDGEPPPSGALRQSTAGPALVTDFQAALREQEVAAARAHRVEELWEVAAPSGRVVSGAATAPTHDDEEAERRDESELSDEEAPARRWPAWLAAAGVGLVALGWWLIPKSSPSGEQSTAPTESARPATAEQERAAEAWAQEAPGPGAEASANAPGAPTAQQPPAGVPKEPFAPARPAQGAPDGPADLPRARALADVGEFELALASLPASSNDPAVLELRASLLMDSGRNDAAMALLTDLASRTKLTPEATLNYAVLLDVAGRSQEAMERYRAFLGEAPKSHPMFPVVARWVVQP
jgi:CheY-like chemotaxis protein/tetratricopeptide (TPR) repeat protein